MDYAVERCCSSVWNAPWEVSDRVSTGSCHSVGRWLDGMDEMMDRWWWRSAGLILTCILRTTCSVICCECLLGCNWHSFCLYLTLLLHSGVLRGDHKMNEVVKRLYVNTTMLAPMVRMVGIHHYSIYLRLMSRIVSRSERSAAIGVARRSSPKRLLLWSWPSVFERKIVCECEKPFIG